jgi:hypothetical protein
MATHSSAALPPSQQIFKTTTIAALANPSQQPNINSNNAGNLSGGGNASQNPPGDNAGATECEPVECDFEFVRAQVIQFLLGTIFYFMMILFRFYSFSFS